MLGLCIIALLTLPVLNKDRNGYYQGGQSSWHGSRWCSAGWACNSCTDNGAPR